MHNAPKDAFYDFKKHQIGNGYLLRYLVTPSIEYNYTITFLAPHFVADGGSK